MATGRILKSQISVSEQVNELSLKAALLFTWMIPHTDDFGRMPGSAKKVKAIVVPMRDDITSVDVEDALNEMNSKRLIYRYKINGETYIEMPKFETHQQGLHKRTKSKFPSPPDADKPPSGSNIPGSSGKFPSELEQELEENIVVFSEPNGSSNTTCPQSSDEDLRTNAGDKVSEAGSDPPSRIDNCPHQAIIDLYHKHIPGGTKVRVWSEDSRKKLRRRWREATERQNLEWWDKFFYNVSQLDFFMGRTEIDYQTNLDALVSPKMFNRIISDHYWHIQQKKQKAKR